MSTCGVNVNGSRTNSSRHAEVDRKQRLAREARWVLQLPCGTKYIVCTADPGPTSVIVCNGGSVPQRVCAEEIHRHISIPRQSRPGSIERRIHHNPITKQPCPYRTRRALASVSTRMCRYTVTAKCISCSYGTSPRDLSDILARTGY